MIPRAWFGAWLAVAAVVRVVAMLDEPAYLHPDALGQALEPAFRAVYGHGGVAWEWQQGLRSWLVAALYVPAFALGKALGAPSPAWGMAPFVALARAITIAIDLAAMAAALGLTARHAPDVGRRAGLVGVAALTALHPAFAIMAGQPLVDVPAAALLLGGLWMAGRGGRGRAGGAAFLLGCAALLRPQLAPAVTALVVVAGVWPRWLPAFAEPRGAALREALLGGAAAVALVAAVDAITWGVPLHSLIAYLRYNLDAGQTAFGAMPADRYAAHFALAMPVAAFLLPALAALGARRAPALALVTLIVIASHQAVPYKVWRFLHPALWLCAVLAGVGVAELLARWPTSSLRRPLLTALAAALLLGGVAAWRAETIWQTTWLWHQGGAQVVERSRGLNRMALAIAALPSPPQRCVQAVLPEAAAPGHALFGHDLAMVHPLGRKTPGFTLQTVDCLLVAPDAGEPPPGFASVPLDPLPADLRLWMRR
ncbi:MAG: hypothetical protein RIT45_4321 [Pseudomonadota bacterium]